MKRTYVTHSVVALALSLLIVADLCSLILVLVFAHLSSAFLAPFVAHLLPTLNALQERNGCELVKIVANAGDAVIFHGHLFHHAVFGSDHERFRPVLACHYVP